ncbi:penicillin acylase family protein [soil metagenome]
MKKVGLVLLTLVVLLVVGAAGTVWYLRSAEPSYDRDQTLAGLDAPVELWRDSLGVPHLWAQSERDLLRAIGYVHASDRLWQMELFRRVADGRLAEVLGENMLETDRFLRTLGMGRVAAETERLLDPESRELIQAYADGVNAWLAEQRGALPPEFVALRIRPERWQLRHTLAIGTIMAWDLADWQIGLDAQRAVDRVGPELAEELHPPYPEWGTTILGEDARWSGGTVAPASSGSRPRAERSEGRFPLPRLSEATVRMLEGISIARASNSWVIGGERTRSGRPILANDMHLALRAPSLWYLAALHGGRFQVTGMMIPGTPVVVAGHSDRVAWGFTNVMLDDVDFFIEQVDPADSTRYQTPDGWRHFEVRPETIQVRGRDPVVHLVRSTRNGPVISDVEERGGDRVLAMRWAAHEPSTRFRALLGMNRARSAAEFDQALLHFDSPHQNVVFADVEGAFGYRMVGRVPVRHSGDGLLPVPGWTDEHAWERYLDPDEMPHVLNPSEDFIVTANNRLIGDRYPFHLSRNWAEPFRAMRIREMIEGGSGFTGVEVAAQQADVRDAFAVRYLPLAIQAADAAGESAAAGALRGWNAEAHPDSHAAALFYSWYEALRRRVGEDEYRGGRMYFPRDALNRILETGASAWVNDVRTSEVETLDELSAAAMQEAVRTVGRRSWGELHETRINHALGSSGALDRALNVNIGPLSRGGSTYTVDVAGYGGTRPPFVNTHGASQRHVVDMGDRDGVGGFIIPTGQSGIPFSRHYRDQTPLWQEGRLWLIPLDRARAEPRIVHRMVLRP